jgi:hypothetical protein
MRILLRRSGFNLVAMSALVLVTLVPAVARAQGTSGGGLGDMILQFIDDWQARATRIQSEQPHWVTPLVTVTPRLEQEYRYDQFWQANQNGRATDNFGGSKGLELIPFQNTEVILGVPAWIAHNGSIQLPTKKKGAYRRVGRPDLSDQVSVAVGKRGKRRLHRDRVYGLQRPDRR